MIDHLFYTDEVEKNDLRSLAVRAFVVNEDPDLTGHLLRAWCLLQENEEEAPSLPGFGAGEEDCRARYSFYMAVYQRAYGPGANEGEPDWPTNCFLPKWFVKQIAVIQASSDKAGLRMYASIRAEMNQDEQSLTAEQFKAKHGFLTAHYTEAR